MENVRIYTNEHYLTNPESHPRQRKGLDKLFGKMTNAGAKPQIVSVNFKTPPGTDIHDHVSMQIFRDLRALTSSKVVTFFGDGGTGLFLAGMDQISSGHAEATGKEIPEIREKPVIIGPGGSHMHGAKFLGTHRISAIGDYINQDVSAHEQPLRIRQGTITTVKAQEPDEAISQKEHFFYGFAGKEFDSHALMINEELDRSSHPLINEIKAFRKLVKDVFFDPSLTTPAKSRLQAWTAMPGWWHAKFNPQMNALGDEGMYFMESEIASGLDIMKIALVIATLGAHSTVLDYFFRKIDKAHETQKPLDDLSILGILDKFRPRYSETFHTEFDPTLMGGHCYSFDGTPHHLDFGEDERAFMNISTVQSPGLKVVKLNA